MRKLSLLFVLFLIAPIVVATPATVNKSVDLEVSKNSQALNLTLSNQADIDASNVSLDVIFYGDSEAVESFSVDELDAGESRTFVVLNKELNSISIQNVSRVSWNVSAVWNERFVEGFDLLKAEEIENSSITDREGEEQDSPIDFWFVRKSFVIYGGEEFSKQLRLGYRPLFPKEVKHLNISIQGPAYLNISQDELVKGTNIRTYSLNAQNVSLEDREHINLTVMANYDTLHTGYGTVEGSREESNYFYILENLVSLVVWLISLPLEVAASALGF